MTKKLYLLVIIAIIIGVIGHKMGGDDTIEIHSDDNKAVLHISQGALPDGVLMEDISITSGDIDGFYGPGTSAFGYELKPDGLQLQKPARISLESSWEPPKGEGEIGVPFLIHKSGDSFDIVDNAEITFDRVWATLNISGDITHFSHLSISAKPYVFHLEMASIRDAQLDETRTVAITSSHSRYQESRSSRYYGIPEYTPVGESWTLKTSGAYVNVSGRSFSPNKIDIPSTTQKIGENIEIKKDVTCVRKGTSNFFSRGKMTFISDIELLVPFYHGKKHTDPDAHSDGSVHSDEEFHSITLLKNKSMTPILSLGQGYVNCAEESMIRLRPYNVVCPDFVTFKSGTYIIDPATGEPEVDSEGFELEASTMIPADDDCRGYKYKE